jgi:Fur family ferric uptake transcriptional regulator
MSYEESFQEDPMLTLRARGHRLTRVRKAVVGVFLKNSAPLSVPQVMAALKTLGVSSDRTTVYREVEFLRQQDILGEVNLGTGIRCYEIRRHSRHDHLHHHHLMCVKCNGVECVELQTCIETEERRILDKMNFKVLNHSLNFYGICARCGDA